MKLITTLFGIALGLYELLFVQVPRPELLLIAGVLALWPTMTARMMDTTIDPPKPIVADELADLEAWNAEFDRRQLEGYDAPTCVKFADSVVEQARRIMPPPRRKDSLRAVTPTKTIRTDAGEKVTIKATDRARPGGLQWNPNPYGGRVFIYQPEKDLYRCAICGTEFTGDYARQCGKVCPRCGSH